MSDEMAAKKEAETNGNGKKAIQLVVTLHPDWTIDCQFPSNQLMARGMLAEAQAQLTKLDTIASLADQAAKAQAARGGLAGLRNRITGGR